MEKSKKFNPTPKRAKLFVAAIDFGTTYSGYAFSPANEKDKVRTNTWLGGGMASLKAPTVLLLNQDQSFNSFGYDAEKKYTELTQQGTYKEYYYFHRFKMLLQSSKNINENTKIKDETNKEMDAMTVFSLSIKFLKDHLIGRLKNEIVEAEEKDIYFVLTVPAIWEERSKLFMRKAANMAEIKDEDLSVALEPEAASVFCQFLPFNVVDVGQSALKEPGAEYMVVDLGGGTADITVHARTAESKLKELCPASGGSWGGKTVEESFIQFLKDLLTEKVFEKFKIDEMEDYLELMRDFEILKRRFTGDSQNESLRMPVSSLDEVIENNTNYDTFAKMFSASKAVSKGLTFKKGRIQFPSKEIEKFFQPAIHGILQHLEKMFTDKRVKGVNKILMVGGFSESKLIQNAVKRTFPGKTIISPHEAGLIVLKGAVYFGYLPDSISVRVSRYTYGIQSWPEFDPKVHPRSKKTRIGGVDRCRDVFFKYVTRGEEVTPGHRKSQTFQILKPDEDALECIVYASEEEDPKFVDEPQCRQVMKLTIPLSSTSPNSRKCIEMEESLIFGETELRCCARDYQTGREFEVTCDFGEH